MYTLCNAMYAALVRMPHTSHLRKKPTKRVNTKHHFKTTKTLKDTRAKASDCKMSKCLNLFLSTMFIVQHMIWSYSCSENVLFGLKLEQFCNSSRQSEFPVEEWHHRLLHVRGAKIGSRSPVLPTDEAEVRKSHQRENHQMVVQDVPRIHQV